MSVLANVLKKYFEIFKGQEGYLIRDIGNLEFFKRNPRNETIEDVQLKVSAINNKELNDLAGMEEMVEHICGLKIDNRLAANDLSVVEDIATVKIRGNAYHMLSFASEYCNYHKPDVYPIYSEEHLELYQRYVEENKLNVKAEDLKKYEVFKTVLDDVLARYELKGKMNYLEVRKFGWAYFEKIMQESTAA